MSSEDSRNSGAKRREERMQRREERGEAKRQRKQERREKRQEGQEVQQEEEQVEDDQDGPDPKDGGSLGAFPSLENGAGHLDGGQQEPSSVVKLLQDIQSHTDHTYR